MSPRATPLPIRLWSKVDKDGPVPSHDPSLGPCWVWTGWLDRNGYGMIGLGGHSGGTAFVHRLTWEWANGREPVHYILHRCDNPACLRPDHLYEGTQAENIRDCVMRGRKTEPPRLDAEDNGNARLTNADVIEIRLQYGCGAVSQRALALSFGVSQGTIGNVVRRTYWKSVG